MPQQDNLKRALVGKFIKEKQLLYIHHYWNMFSGAFGQLTAADQSGVEEDEKDDLLSMSKTSNSKNLSEI